MELTKVIVASLIVAMSVPAVALGMLRRQASDRTALWFGVAGLLYGVRLAGDSELVQLAMPDVSWRHVTTFITYAILVPAGLVVESLFGAGWRGTLRLSWQVAAVYATFAILYDLWRGQPGAALWLNMPVVLTLASLVVAHLVVRWWRGRWPAEFRVVAAGGLVFLGVAAYSTITGNDDFEPLALLVFVTSMGYFVGVRAVANERRVVTLSRELELAREIQQSILPSELPQPPGLGVAACYLPMSDIGGDFYDFHARDPRRLGVLVADVTGHGVPAALVASMVKMTFATQAEWLDDPGLVLTNMNRDLCGRFAGAFVTACCVVLDRANGTLRYASAGHPPPLLRSSQGRVTSLDARGLLLAFDPTVQYATTEVALHGGDRLVLYSDGIIEACSAADEFFGDTRLEQLLAGSAAGTPERSVDEIVAEVRNWVGPAADFQDDITIVVVDVEPDSVTSASARP